MTTCTSPGCDFPASVAVRTTRPSPADIRSTVYYTPEVAPRTAQRYCRSCAEHLLAELVTLLGE